MSTAPDFHYLYTDPSEEDDMNDTTDTAAFTDALQGLLDGDFDSDAAFPYVQLRAATFRDAGVLTTNDGLVVTLSDGSEFQVTVVRSR